MAIRISKWLLIFSLTGCGIYDKPLSLSSRLAADAGPDQKTVVTRTVVIDGTGSYTSNGKPLLYQWTQLSGPAISLQGADTALPTFTSPESNGEPILLQLEVSDGEQPESTDTVAVSIETELDAFDPVDPDGRRLLDVLFVYTAEAAEEIQEQGSSVNGIAEDLVAKANATIRRSLITSSKIRLVGVHTLTEEDYARVGHRPGDTLDNLRRAPAWTGEYRGAYGADHIIMIAGTQEAKGSKAAYASFLGDALSMWVDFLPFEHEFGHLMGLGDCTAGEGFAFRNIHPDLPGGTRMCGNSAPFFSNPDVVVTLDQIYEMFQQGIMDALGVDYRSLLGEGYIFPMGAEGIGNSVAVWRNNEVEVANTRGSSKSNISTRTYAKADCAGFYSSKNYENFAFELCAGDEITNVDARLQAFQSVSLGENTMLSLYSIPLDSSSNFGGQALRTLYSIDQLDNYLKHQVTPWTKDNIKSLTVFQKTDRSKISQKPSSLFKLYHPHADTPLPALNDDTLTLLRGRDRYSSSAALGKFNFDRSFTLDFQYYSKHDAANRVGGLLEVVFAKDNVAYETSEEVPINYDGKSDGTGYSLTFNYSEEGRFIVLMDGNKNEISVRVPQSSTHTNGEWINVQVQVTSSSVKVNFDDQPVFEASVALDLTSHKYIGFAAKTGFYPSDLLIKNPLVTF